MLEAFRILDLTDERGHLTGRILADLGADVIKVEPPGGDSLRADGPFVGDRAGPERGLRWLAANAGKRSVVLDLAGSDQDRAAFRRLAASADAVVETAAPGELERIGLDPETMRRELPRLVWCSITPFGRTGPRSGYRAHDLVIVAMGGNATMTGERDGSPLRCTLPTAYFHAGPEAAAALLVALYGRQQTGRGDLVDVSMHECQVGTLLGGVGAYALTRRGSARAGAHIGRTREIWRTRDGWVTFGLRGGPARVKNLQATSDYMAEHVMQPDWLRDYDWSTYNHNTLTDEDIVRFEAAFGDFFATRTMRELYEQALKRRIMLAPCNDAREIIEHAQLRARDLFCEIDYAHLGASVEHVGYFARIDGEGIGARKRAPLLGEHQRLIEDDDRGPRPVIGRTTSGGEASAGSAIFEGLKVVEFGSGVAGPCATRYFTDRGARVIRVESTERPDFLRLLHLTSRDDPHGLDKAPMFVLLNPNKESVTLNLASPQGVGLARRLVDWADVVSENFAPGVMERWGIGADELRRRRPQLIYVSGCLFGQTGPQRSYPGFGGQGAAISGFNHLTGLPDAEALGPYGTITDSLAPRYIGLLIAAALIERDRTGRGCTIDVSQIETGVYSLAEMVVRYTARGEIVSRQANHDERAAPHSIYPCRGDDRWIAIAVRSAAQWVALRQVMGDSSWGGDGDLETVAGRLARSSELDARIGAWTAGMDAYELMAALQEAGVEAGVVQTFADLLDDPQLAHREHFRPVRHPYLGEVVLERLGFRLASHEDRLRTAGPGIGADNVAVLGGILGIEVEEIRRLETAGVVR